MITRMRIRNFKSFGPDSDWFPLGKLTLILGANASGKSTILQALLLLAQSWRQPLGFAELQPDGDLLQLGHFWHLSHNKTGEPARFAVEFDGRSAVELCYEIRHSDSDPAAKLHSVKLGLPDSSGSEETLWEWVLTAARGRADLLEFRLVNTSKHLARLDNPFSRHIDAAWNRYLEQDEEKFLDNQEKMLREGSEDNHLPTQRYQSPELDLLFYMSPEGNSFSLSAPGDSAELGDASVAIESPYFDRNRSECGMDTLVQSTLLNPGLLQAAHDLDSHFRSIVQPLMSLRDALAELAYVGPSRLPGQRLYTQRPNGAEPSWVGADGRYCAAVLDSLGPKAIDELNANLKRQNVPYRLKLERVGNPVLGRLLRLTRIFDGDDNHVAHFDVDVCDVGYGVSQVLPIIIQLLAHRSRHSAKDRTLRPLLVEQPELHLHPSWQADVTSLLLERWPNEPADDVTTTPTQAEVQSIVETHSETMVLRVRRLLRAGLIGLGEVQVLAVSRDKDRPSVVSAIEFKSTGWFDREKVPGGFFPARLDEELG